MTPTVFAGLIDIELMVGMLDHRHPQALLLEANDDLLDQGGLARARKTRKTYDFHAHCFAM
jgi:hypothetical protein